MFRDLGRSTYEQDAHKIRPLVMERTRLTRAVSATATTVYLNKLPRNAFGYGGWLAIDINSVTCEVRRILGIAGKKVTLNAALAYDHPAKAEILYLDRPWVNAIWFTATGDNSTNNEAALNMWGLQAAYAQGVAYLPAGTYVTGTAGTALAWTTTSPNFSGVCLVGDGRNSVIKAAGSITMMEVDRGDRAAAQVFRNGVIRDVLFEGNSLATVGIYFGKAVMYQTQNVTVQYVIGPVGAAGVILDRSQNQQHNTLYVNNCNQNLVIMNGAANNNFYNLHATEPNLYSLRMEEAAEWPGYATADTNGANQNKFYGGIFEPHSATAMTAMVFLEKAERNLFSGCDFVRPASGSVTLLKIGTAAPMNRFVDGCRFNAYNNAYEPLIENKGDGSLFRDSWFSDPPSAMNAIQVDDGWVHISGCTFAVDFTPTNVTSGNVYSRVRTFQSDRNNGITGEEEDPGDATGVFFYNEDLDMPTWRNQTSAAYNDALNNKIRAFTKTTATIAGGTATISRSYHSIETPGGTTALGTVHTFTRTNDISMFWFSSQNGARDVVVQHNTGNILCDGGTDLTFDTVSDKGLALWDELNTKWCVAKIVSV